MAFPSVKFKIIDKTYIAPPVDGDTRIFIPFFSEKGEDGKIFKLYSPEQVVALFGKPNSYKYGNGLYYVLKALEYDNVIVWGMRVTPPKSTYAAAQITVTETPKTTSVSQDATNTNTINVADTSIFTEGETVAVYDQNDIYGTLKFVKVTAVDTSNNTITIDTSLTVTTSYVVSTLPKFTLGTVDTSGLTDYQEFTDTSMSMIFIARGKGAYYNNVKLVFEQNTTLEEYYVDEESYNTYLPNNFYNVTVVEQKPGATPVVLENTYTVSLASQTPDGNPVINPSTGVNLYIKDVINNNSYNVYVVINDLLQSEIDQKEFLYGYAFNEFLNSNNYQIQLSGGLTNPTALENGSIIDSEIIDPTTQKSVLIEVYNGTYNRAAGEMLISQYPFKPYEVEYVVDYTGDPDVQQAVCQFAQTRDDCVAIISAPYSTNFENDITWRVNAINQSQYNATATQGTYGDYYDPYNKKTIQFPLSYWLMDEHLYVDTKMDLTVPVAGLNGGALRTPIQNPSYLPNIEEAKALSKYQINPMVKTADGTYFFVEQKTLYKRSTYLQRVNYVKFINKIKKDLSPRLYDLLQRKATTEIVALAKSRVSNYLSNFTVGKSSMNIIEEYSVNAQFDKTTNVLNVVITLKFVGIVEEIDVTLIVTQ